MSLVIWLPLVSNTNNQGIGDHAFTASNITYTNGKLGKAATFNGTNSTLYANNVSIGNAWSVCFWAKLNSAATHSLLHLGNSASYSASQIVIHSSENGGIYVICNTTANAVSNVPFTNWNHYAVTYNGSSLLVYINGTLTSSWTVSTALLSGSRLTIGSYYASTIFANGQIQDVRVYDNVISPKEVKEISKGLMVHYTLSNPGGQNLVANSAPLDLTGWATGGTNWTNSLVDCTLSPYGKAVRSTYTGSGGVQGGIHKQPYDYTALTNGATYTVSAWVRASKSCVITFSNEYMSPGSTPTITTEWQKISYTHSIDTSRSYHSNIFYVRAADVTTNMWIEVFGLKLEKSDHATPWCPHTSDAAYSRMGYNDATEYDVSGFRYNGTKVGSVPWDPNTAKYTGSLSFNGGTSNYVYIPQAIYRAIIGSTEAVTASIWAKRATWATPSSHTEQLFCCTEGGGFAVYLNISSGCFSVICGTGASSNTYQSSNSSKTIANYGFAANTWHMFTMTYDGLALKLYIDGTLDKTVSAYSTKTPIFYQTNTMLFLGAEAGTNGIDSNYMFTGNLSDFRWYATALSADDILELYNSAGSISNNGTLLTNEVTE